MCNYDACGTEMGKEACHKGSGNSAELVCYAGLNVDDSVDPAVCVDDDCGKHGQPKCNTDSEPSFFICIPNVHRFWHTLFPCAFRSGVSS